MNVRRIGCFYLILILCLSAAACSGSLFRNYGRINTNGEVTQAFEGYRVNSEFRYYVSGAHHYPNALMGLHRDHRLDPSTLWREVSGMTTVKMKEIVDNMKTKASQHQTFQYGFEMSDNKGRPIGVWYSVLWARTFLRMNEDGTVRIDTPDLDIYERLERDVVVDSPSI
ncbi:MAG: hypothetical protein KKC25_10995 [Proteobacteria bacterium]|nr:hypothetical protein [Pseudomonadota bacterium]